MNVLFIGDIVGKVGRKALFKNLSFIRDKYQIDFTICNGENISNGRGMNENHYDFLSDLGIDCITLGNHYKNKDDIYKVLDNENIIRPANLVDETKGVGSRLYDCEGVKIRVSNLLGETFMRESVHSPYEVLEEIVMNDESDIHIVDFHAETNGEKKGIAFLFKDQINALIGTHTHVQTVDAEIINGTIAYISDVGMCGAYHSILGCDAESIVKKMILKTGKSYTLPEKDDSVFSAVIITFDDLNFNPVKINPLYIIDKRETLWEKLKL